MQVNILSAQLGFGSGLAGWYWGETSVPYGHFLIEFSARTDDRLRYSANNGSIPSKSFFNPERLKQSKKLEVEQTKSPYSPSVPIISPEVQKSIPSVLSFRLYPVSLRMHSKSAQRKPAKRMKSSLGKISKKIDCCLSTNNLETRKRHSGVRKRLTAQKKILLLPSLTLCLDMRQFVLAATSVYKKSLITQSVTKQELLEYKSLQNPTYQIDSVEEDMNKKLFSKADSSSSVDKVLSYPGIKLSNWQRLILVGVETGIFLSDFAQQLRRQKTDAPHIYFTLLDFAGISSTKLLNQNAKARKRKLGPFQNLNVRSCISVIYRVIVLMGLWAS